MLEEKKLKHDSSDAPPPTSQFSDTQSINDYFIICPHCSSSSSIEIISINEKNNTILFNCVKEKKNYIMPIKEYLKKIKEYLKKIKDYKQKNLNELKDKCKTHINNNYICYCFDCNCHLCNECLKTRIHINHRKSNIIEIKPIKEELNIIDEVIKDYKNKLNELEEEKKKQMKN